MAEYHIGRTCPNGEFLCNNGQCIGMSSRCNGREDCIDGDDEGLSCKSFQCSSDSYWKCMDNMQCIFSKEVCDGKNYDCQDKSDENSTLCGCMTHQTDHWPCRNGDGCVPRSSICDGSAGCGDGSDELYSVCDSWNCSQGLWKCDDMKCIEISGVCDGAPHCNDSSDEQSCRNWTCIENWVNCMDTLQCIREDSLCDGKYDCLDLSDEQAEFCLEYKCLAGHTKCADHLQCIKTEEVCDGTLHCLDGTDELCDSPCLNINLDNRKPIIKKCVEDSTACFPMDQFCDGAADCREGSDETWSYCMCEHHGHRTCNASGHDLCLAPDWITRNNSIGKQPCMALLNEVKNDDLGVKGM